MCCVVLPEDLLGVIMCQWYRPDGAGTCLGRLGADGVSVMGPRSREERSAYFVSVVTRLPGVICVEVNVSVVHAALFCSREHNPAH